MVKENKRKKFHDKDKYYRLAKEQGYRSRAAFKLVQINRKYNILESCQSAVLDLCAAPGGWTQVAARTCPSSCSIVAVDILPIRRLGDRRVTTIVGDITTDKCRSDIQRALGGSSVDLVLHDGAPNVGAEYGKDAFVQNELALAALRTAIQHLKPSGTFITKVYRSRDYHALQWAVSQLFESVAVHKPAASRQQSAEIFLIGLQYKAPKSVDSRLTDPKHVFAMVEDNADPTSAANSSNTVSVFSSHQPKRQRQGYDTNHYSFTTLRHVEPVRKFVEADSVKQAIQMLSTSTELCFTCDVPCEQKPSGCATCAWLKQRASDEIQEQCSDLQLLSKADFKRLLLWRNKMHDDMKSKAKGQSDSDEERDGDDKSVNSTRSRGSDDEDEDAIQEELKDVKERRAREKKRRLKKERKEAAARRRRSALGMDLNAIDITDHDNVFSLASLGNHQLATEVNLDQMTDEQIFGEGSDDEIYMGGEGDDEDADDEETQRRRRERDLEEAYAQYLQNTKSGVDGTKAAKRSKKLERQKLADEAHEDQEMAMTQDVSYNVKSYAKLLQGNESDDDDDEEASGGEESNDGFNEKPMTPAEHRAARQQERNPLMHQFQEEKASSKTARWFSNPLFATIEKAAASAPSTSDRSAKREARVSNTKPTEEKEPLTAEDIIASMPKTDKQKRHDKRLKQIEKDERKRMKRAAKVGQSETEFQLVAAADSEEEVDEEDKINAMTDAERKRELGARELIRAGLGDAANATSDKRKLEIVPEDRPFPAMDSRKYDSDNEDYDSDDHAKTLAIGTMILRRSKEKAFVDASYNRYAWNDPSDLPEWFVDDETRNYRPQLPIPPALMAKMKEKMMALSTKPIAKVAEARARKSRRAKLKLAAAKKKAEAVANSNEMTESMKLKAISQALRGQEAKRPGKTYVVAKKGRSNNGVKGAKLVDKRQKSDKRSLDRAEKKRKKGKQGGLVGSKKRRRHK